MMRLVGKDFSAAVSSIPDDSQLADQTAIVVNSACLLNDIALIYSLDNAGRPVPARTLSLSSSCKSATLARPDATTLVVRPQGGFLPPRGFCEEEEALPAISMAYFLRDLDLLVRSDRNPMKLGETVELTAATIEVTALTEDNRPAEVTFRFRTPLEDPSLRWFQLDERRYVPFTLPAVGETVKVRRAF